MKVVCFDLDDTLYKEVDYLKSAYKEIANYAVKHCSECVDSSTILAKAYNVMFTAYMKGENAFKCLNEFLCINLPISEYLQIYHEHKPDIKLSEDTISTLDALKSLGCVIGLITDGRSLQQRNKIEALGLYRWICNENIVISEEFGSEKPNFANYEYFMKLYPNCHDFWYVGDNLQKDFVAANALKWTTVCLKDDGKNIHRQDISIVREKKSKKTVIKLADIIKSTC